MVGAVSVGVPAGQSAGGTVFSAFPWVARVWHALPLGPRRRLRHLQVVMYTRQGCHLCEAAWQQLRLEQRRYGFGLRAVNVDGDPELAARYGQEVPVVTVRGEVRFRGFVSPVLLRRLLEAETRAAARGAEPGSAG
jgi:hypothetical protein